MHSDVNVNTSESESPGENELVHKNVHVLRAGEHIQGGETSQRLHSRRLSRQTAASSSFIYTVAESVSYERLQTRRL